MCPAYAVFVLARDGRHWSRRLYITLTGATRAVERAHARGVEVQVQLVELVPVPGQPVVMVAGGGR